MQTIISHSPQQTEQAGIELAKTLRSGDTVAFFGGLGMGKTAMIRGLAKGLGITDCVSSPTFALVHEYRGEPPLYHFDMYRVTSYDDLYSTGFFDYLEHGGICAIEWSENIENVLPENAILVNIARGDTGNGDNVNDDGDETRIITIKRGVEDENTGG